MVSRAAGGRPKGDRQMSERRAKRAVSSEANNVERPGAFHSTHLLFDRHVEFFKSFPELLRRKRRANRVGMKRVSSVPRTKTEARWGRNSQQLLGKSGCGLAFTRHQKREPARVRLRREAQSGGWHRPHGPRRYPNTPLPHGTDGSRANRSTCEGNLATVGVGSPGPERVETAPFTPRRMS
jgi:hypothetical protein